MNDSDKLKQKSQSDNGRRQITKNLCIKRHNVETKQHKKLPVQVVIEYCNWSDVNQDLRLLNICTNTLMLSKNH